MKDEGLRQELTGAFLESLKRNNKQIREDRAQAIAEDAQLVFRRKLEDLELSIKKMKREQENMLDMSPTNSQSLVLASDFSAEDYVAKELDLSIKIRNTTIKLEEGQNRYNYLFGGK